MQHPGEQDRALEQAVLDLLAARRPGATICPSEAARAVGTPDTWRTLMPAARAAAGRLVEEGRVEVTQAGRPVDVRTARGPVRIRRPGAVAEPEERPRRSEG